MKVRCWDELKFMYDDNRQIRYWFKILFFSLFSVQTQHYSFILHWLFFMLFTWHTTSRKLVNRVNSINILYRKCLLWLGLLFFFISLPCCHIKITTCAIVTWKCNSVEWEQLWMFLGIFSLIVTIWEISSHIRNTQVYIISLTSTANQIEKIHLFFCICNCLGCELAHTLYLHVGAVERNFFPAHHNVSLLVVFSFFLILVSIVLVVVVMYVRFKHEPGWLFDLNLLFLFHRHARIYKQKGVIYCFYAISVA